ncbi:hypothetical protein D9M72_542930 [compost metagenome]
MFHDFGGVPDNLWIDVNPDAALPVELDHRHPLQDTDMRSGDADTRCRSHRVEQVVRKGFERRIKVGNGVRLLAQ